MPESDALENATRLVRLSSKHAEADAQVRRDGRVEIRPSRKASRIAKELQRKSRRHLIPIGEDLTRNHREYDSQLQSMLGKYSGIPTVNIAIHIVGSRGDVQPFVPIGQILSRPPYSHRVRICTRPVFKDFVQENDIEFFSIGGDPAVLMAYVVKNPGLMPGRESLKAGKLESWRCWEATG
jgi:sterol 3beta-glucosyltransferase